MFCDWNGPTGPLCPCGPVSSTLHSLSRGRCCDRKVIGRESLLLSSERSRSHAHVRVSLDEALGFLPLALVVDYCSVQSPNRWNVLEMSGSRCCLITLAHTLTSDLFYKALLLKAPEKERSMHVSLFFFFFGTVHDSLQHSSLRFWLERAPVLFS